jgi:hypothetical protein
MHDRRWVDQYPHAILLHQLIKLAFGVCMM